MSEAAIAVKRIFVANRGEIALRVIRAAHSLGIESVLGMSAADQGDDLFSSPNQS